MSVRLTPIVLVSFEDMNNPSSGINFIKKNSQYFSDSKYSRFFKHISISNDGVLSCDEKSIDVNIKESCTRRENFKNLNYTELVAFVKNACEGLYSQENITFSNENNIELTQVGPTILFISYLSTNLFLPVYFRLLEQRAILTHSTASIQVVLLNEFDYHDGTERNKILNEISCYKNLEAFYSKNTSCFNPLDRFWLVDKTNEKNITITNQNTLYKSISGFIDMTHRIELKGQFHSNNYKIFSSFGISYLIFPVEKIKKFLTQYIMSTELSLFNTYYDTYQCSKDVVRSSLLKFFDKKISNNSIKCEDISASIALKDDNESIYTEFKFDTEKRNNYLNKEKQQSGLSKKDRYHKIQDTTDLAAASTSAFKTKLRELEENHQDDILRNAYPEKSSSKKRTQKELSHLLDDTMNNYLNNKITKEYQTERDDYGHAHAIVCCAFLSGEEKQDKYEKLISNPAVELRTPITSFVSLQASLKDKILKDLTTPLQEEIKIYEGDKEVLENNLEHYKALLKKQSNVTDSTTLTTSGNDELLNNQKEYKDKIQETDDEIARCDEKIERFNLLIQDLRDNFNPADNYIKKVKDQKHDFFVDKYEETEKSIDENDKDLISHYEKKNKNIKSISEVVKWNIVIYPLVAAFLILLFRFGLWKIFGDFFAWDLSFKNNMIIHLMPSCLILLYGLFLYYMAEKALTNTISLINDKLDKKDSYFTQLINYVNNREKTMFQFEIDINACEILDYMINQAKDKATTLYNYKDFLTTQYKKAKKELKEFSWTDSELNFSVIEQDDVIKFWSKRNYFLINDQKQLSDYQQSSTHINLLKDIQEFVNSVCKPLDKKKISDVLFNHEQDFPFAESQRSIELEKIKDNSRILLQLGHGDNILSEDILLGDSNKKLEEEFKVAGVKTERNAEKENNKKMGLFSHKSNIPAWSIKNVVENETEFLKLLKAGDTDKYFTHSEHEGWVLAKDIAVEKEVADENNYTSLLYLFLFNEIVYSIDSAAYFFRSQRMGVSLSMVNGLVDKMEELQEKIHQIQYDIDNKEISQNELLKKVEIFCDSPTFNVMKKDITNSEWSSFLKQLDVPHDIIKQFDY